MIETPPGNFSLCLYLWCNKDFFGIDNYLIHQFSIELRLEKFEQISAAEQNKLASPMTTWTSHIYTCCLQHCY